MPKSQTAALFAASAPANDGFRRQPLRAAVLSARPARLMAALDRLAITAIDATRADLALLLRDAPDMLVVDIEPGTVSARRLALLVAQLGWARRDLVIAVASGRTAALGGLAFDLTFDPEAGDAALDAAFAEAGHLLTHSRLRPAGTTGSDAHAPSRSAPALLRRAAATRRSHLFR